MPLHLIWAEDQAGGIGQDGDLPWRQRTDLQRFKALTLGHAVVMGRRTWESLPFPLPGRENLVLSPRCQPGVTKERSGPPSRR